MNAFQTAQPSFIFDGKLFLVVQSAKESTLSETRRGRGVEKGVPLLTGVKLLNRWAKGGSCSSMNPLKSLS